MEFFNGLIEPEQVKSLYKERVLCIFKLLKDGRISKIQIFTPLELKLTTGEFLNTYKAFCSSGLFHPWTEDIDFITFSVPLVYRAPATQ